MEQEAIVGQYLAAMRVAQHQLEQAIREGSIWNDADVEKVRAASEAKTAAMWSAYHAGELGQDVQTPSIPNEWDLGNGE
jgi:hypothetical protein